MQVLTAARKAGLRVFYAFIVAIGPATTGPGSTSRRSRTPLGRTELRTRTWGGEIRREFAPQPGESWPSSIGGPWLCQHRSGFAAQETRHPRVHRHGTHRPTCGGSVRFAAELGYQVTIVKDATADYSDEEIHAAIAVNIPNYARPSSPHMKSSTRLFYPHLRHQCAVVLREKSEGMSLSTSPRAIQCLFVSSRSPSRPSCARASGHCVSGSAGWVARCAPHPSHALPPAPLHRARARSAGRRDKAACMPIRSHAVGPSSAQSVAMPSKVNQGLRSSR